MLRLGKNIKEVQVSFFVYSFVENLVYVGLVVAGIVFRNDRVPDCK